MNGELRHDAVAEVKNWPRWKRDAAEAWSKQLQEDMRVMRENDDYARRYGQ